MEKKKKSLYKLGVRKEYYLMEKLRKEGFDIVFRTAGSHSPIDVVAINTKNKEIKLIQSKRTLNQEMSYINPQVKGKILKENLHLTGTYNIHFDVQ